MAGSAKGVPNFNEEITDSESADSDGGDDKDDTEEEEIEVRLLAAMATRFAAVVQVEEEDVEAFGNADENALEGGADGDPLVNEHVVESHIENVRIVQQYIQEISSATFDNGNLDEDVVERLRNPLEGEVDLSDPDIRLSLDIFLSCSHASEATYISICDAIRRRFPDTQILSHHLAKKTLERLTGVVSVLDDMCVNSCHAFTGPLKDCITCSECGEARYHDAAPGQQPKARQQVCTIPLGPQIQALRRSKTGAIAMRYRDRKTQEILEDNDQDPIYDDIFSGSTFLAFLDFAERVQLGPHDTTVTFSLDGAQLYQNKKSDTWIAIWIINDYHPNTRYKKKHVLPALVIPGPNKPKNIDSFVYRSFHHLSALQHENESKGLRVWDAYAEETILSRIFFLFGTADAVGLTEIDGRVGHHGTHGCRVSCGMKGRHKPNSGHYCAAHLRPSGSLIDDNNHPDYNFRAQPKLPSVELYQINLEKVIASRNQTDYEHNRKLTGISKPSILSGLSPERALPVPSCFTLDLMHLLFINLGELLVPLWRGTLSCDSSDDKNTWNWATLTGNTWLEHGKLVADAKKYFPSSFHRPPRNPADKISSGYKATEYFLYLFGLGPALFRTVLPKEYWQHFCKLAHAVRIITQRRISQAQVREAHYYLTQFVEGYEHMYYQRRMDWLHFCRPCIHALLHAAPEITRVGPGAYLTQFTMERAIGDLSGDIRQPSNIYGNLCQIALQQSQVNALKTLCPEFDPNSNPSLPTYSIDIGNGYVFLRPRDKRAVNLSGAACEKVDNTIGRTKIRRWGRLRLPNGQVARSRYKEERSTLSNQRISRNIKVFSIILTDPATLSFTQFRVNNEVKFGEVLFFFLNETLENTDYYALVSLYGPPMQTFSKNQATHYKPVLTTVMMICVSFALHLSFQLSRCNHFQYLLMMLVWIITGL